MMLRKAPWVALLSAMPLLASLAPPSAWVPARWNGANPADPARQAIRAGLQGIVLEGDFPTGTAARVRDMLADAHATVVELTSRARMPLGGPDPIIGTYQGVWPGIQVFENGVAGATRPEVQ